MPANRTPKEAALNAKGAELIAQLGSDLNRSARRLGQMLTALDQVRKAGLEPGATVAHLEAAWECIAAQE